MAKNKIEIPDWLKYEMENWSRYCWSGSYPHPLPPTHCGSPEWQYERIREEGEIESVDNKPIPINYTNAKIVQSVYDALPIHQAQALRAEYPQRHSGTRRHYIMQVGKKVYDSALNSALYRITIAFQGTRI